MRKIILLFAISMSVLSVTAQENNNVSELNKFSLAYYSSNVIAADYNFTDRFSGEFKSFVNCEIEDISTELELKYNFEAREYHQFRVGAGLRLNPGSGEDAAFTIPFQIHFYPFKQNKRISAIMELAPEIYFEDLYKLRSLIGISYSFF